MTGGTGFVGAHVVRALLARGGESVRCLARPGGDRSNLEGLDVEIVDGDLRDRDSLRAACAGCSEVYHCAADYRLFARRPREIYASNVDGTRTLLQLAERAGVRRIVYTSSVGALGLEPGGTPATEATPVTISSMVGHYKRSKYLAERAAEEAAAAGAPVVIVNPSTPVGELDVKPTPTGRIILDFLNRKMPGIITLFSRAWRASRRPGSLQDRGGGGLRSGPSRRQRTASITGSGPARIARTWTPAADRLVALPGRERAIEASTLLWRRSERHAVAPADGLLRPDPVVDRFLDENIVGRRVLPQPV